MMSKQSIYVRHKDEIFKKELTKENIGTRIQTRIEINNKMEYRISIVLGMNSN